LGSDQPKEGKLLLAGYRKNLRPLVYVTGQAVLWTNFRFVIFAPFVSIMQNPTEKDEREYLEQMKEKLLLATMRVDKNVRDLSEELRQNKQYIHEHQHGLDEADLVAADQSLNRMARRRSRDSEE
jgi:hypothetical protein